MPRPWKRVPKALRTDEVERLLDQPDTSTVRGLRDRAIMEFAYATGARATEVVTIRVPNLSLTEQTVRIMGKGGTERIVPIGSKALDWVQRYRTEVRDKQVFSPGHGLLFLSCYGKPLTRIAFWRIVRRHAEACGLDAGPHTLRHSCAVHLLEGGMNIRQVQEFLGHRSINTTQIYTKVTMGWLKEQHGKHPLENGLNQSQ